MLDLRRGLLLLLDCGQRHENDMKVCRISLQFPHCLGRVRERWVELRWIGFGHSKVNYATYCVATCSV